MEHSLSLPLQSREVLMLYAVPSWEAVHEGVLWTLLGAVALWAYIRFLTLSRSGTKIFRVFSPFACFCHNVQLIPSEVTGASNSYGSPALGELLRVSICFISIFAFLKFAALIPLYVSFLYPAAYRTEALYQMGSKNPPKPQNFYKVLHLLYVLRSWIGLPFINHNFGIMHILPDQKIPQIIIVVPGPWIFCGFTIYPPPRRCSSKVCRMSYRRGESSHVNIMLLV